MEIAPSNLTGAGDRPQGLPKCTGSVTAPKGRHLYEFGDRPQGSLSGIATSRIVGFLLLEPFTYALYFVIAILFFVISCYHIVAYLAYHKLLVHIGEPSCCRFCA